MLSLSVAVGGAAGGRGLRLRQVRVDDHWITLTLADGRRLRIPTAWSARLVRTSSAGRSRYRLVAGSRKVWWPETGEMITLRPFRPSRRPKRTAAFPALSPTHNDSAPDLVGSGDRLEGV